MSALQAVRVREHAGHVLLHEGRSGAGDESTRSTVAGDGTKDHMVSGGRDSVLAIAICAGFGNATRSLAMTDCLIAVAVSPHRNEFHWRPWRPSSAYIGRSISI